MGGGAVTVELLVGGAEGGAKSVVDGAESFEGMPVDGAVGAL